MTYLIVNKNNAEVYTNLDFAAKRLSFIGGGEIFKFPTENLAMAKKCELDTFFACDAHLYPSPVDGEKIANVSDYVMIYNSIFPKVEKI